MNAVQAGKGILDAVGIACMSYFMAKLQGQPTYIDIAVGVIGLVCLLGKRFMGNGAPKPE